jgi:hypothetical protein
MADAGSPSTSGIAAALEIANSGLRRLEGEALTGQSVFPPAAMG